VTGWLGLGIPALLGLEAIALIAGVGITAIGPGGVLVPIALFALTSLSPGRVAGTAIITHVGTGLLGSAAYRRSRQLQEPLTTRTAAILSAAAVCGVPAGVLLNGLIGRHVFSLMLGAVVAMVGVLVWTRARPSGSPAGVRIEHPTLHPGAIGLIGFGVAVVSGLLGLGGPLLSVPLLVAAGVPILAALAAAQVQSVVIAAGGSVGYLLRGTIAWPLALAIGLPELVGVLIGWRVARRVPSHLLTRVLAVGLLALAPYLALR
jgi:uncharacterized membrane protein YfcA